MKYKALIITLLAGAVLAGGAYTVTTSLSHDVAETGAWRDGAAKATTGIKPVESASPLPSPAKAPEGRNTFAGTTDGGQAGLAIAMNNGKAVAYICDGRAAESWMTGPAESGKINLRSAKGTGTLTGAYANGVAAGTVTAGKKTWHFRIKLATAPSGLYRSAAGVRKRLDASWAIVPPNNQQFGVRWVDGVPEPAPVLDTATDTATVDGTAYAVTPVPAPQ
jgi:serine/threonine-protein kinase